MGLLAAVRSPPRESSQPHAMLPPWKWPMRNVWLSSHHPLLLLGDHFPPERRRWKLSKIARCDSTKVHLVGENARTNGRIAPRSSHRGLHERTRASEGKLAGSIEARISVLQVDSFSPASIDTRRKRSRNGVVFQPNGHRKCCSVFPMTPRPSVFSQCGSSFSLF